MPTSNNLINNGKVTGKPRMPSTTVFTGTTTTNVAGRCVSQVSVKVRVPIAPARQVQPNPLVLPPTPPLLAEFIRRAGINGGTRNSGTAITTGCHPNDNPPRPAKSCSQSSGYGHAPTSTTRVPSTCSWDMNTYRRTRPNTSLVNLLPESDTSLPVRSERHKSNAPPNCDAPLCAKSDQRLGLSETAEQRYRLMDRYVADSEDESEEEEVPVVSAGSDLTVYGSVQPRRPSFKKFRNTHGLNRAAISVFENEDYSDLQDDSQWLGSAYDTFSSGVSQSSLKQPAQVKSNSKASKTSGTRGSKGKLSRSKSFQGELKSIIHEGHRKISDNKTNMNNTSTWNQFVDSLNKKLKKQRIQIEKEQRKYDQIQEDKLHERELEKIRMLQLNILEEQLIHYNSQQNKAIISNKKTSNIVTNTHIRPSSKTSQTRGNKFTKPKAKAKPKSKSKSKQSNFHIESEKLIDQLYDKLESVKKQKRSKSVEKRKQTQNTQKSKAIVKPANKIYQKPIAKSTQVKKTATINKKTTNQQVTNHQTTRKQIITSINIVPKTRALNPQKTSQISKSKLNQCKHVDKHKTCSMEASNQDDRPTSPIRVAVPTRSPCLDVNSCEISESFQRKCHMSNYYHSLPEQCMKKGQVETEDHVVSSEDCLQYTQRSLKVDNEKYNSRLYQTILKDYDTRCGKSMDIPLEDQYPLSRRSESHDRSKQRQSETKQRQSETKTSYDDNYSFCWHESRNAPVTPKKSPRSANCTLERCGISPIGLGSKTTGIERLNRGPVNDKCHWSPALAGSVMPNKWRRGVKDDSAINSCNIQSVDKQYESLSRDSSDYEYSFCDSTMDNLPSTIPRINNCNTSKYVQTSPIRQPRFENENTLCRKYGKDTVLYSSYDADTPAARKHEVSNAQHCCTMHPCNCTSSTSYDNSAYQDCSPKITDRSIEQTQLKLPIECTKTVSFPRPGTRCSPLDGVQQGMSRLCVSPPQRHDKPSHIGYPSRANESWSYEEERYYIGGESIEEYSLYDYSTNYRDTVRSTHSRLDGEVGNSSESGRESSFASPASGTIGDICQRCGSLSRVDCYCSPICPPSGLDKQVAGQADHADIVVRNIFQTISRTSCCAQASFASMTAPGFDFSSRAGEFAKCPRCQGSDCQLNHSGSGSPGNLPTKRSKSRKRRPKTAKTTGKAVRAKSAGERLIGKSLPARKVGCKNKKKQSALKSTNDKLLRRRKSCQTRSLSRRSKAPIATRRGTPCQTTVSLAGIETPIQEEKLRSPIVPLGTSLSGRTPMTSITPVKRWSEEPSCAPSRCKCGPTRQPVTCTSAFVHSRACEMALRALKQQRMPLPLYEESPYWLNPKYLRQKGSASCEKYGRATFSSMSRSRSTSPFALDTPCEERPPFVVRKAEFSKIAGRTPGMKKVDNKYTKKLKSRSPSPRRRQTYGSYCSEQCIHCNGDFPESDCMLCRVYRRYSGKPYSEHYDQLCCLQRKGLKSCDISCEYDPPMSSYQTALHHSLSPENTVTGVSSSSSFLSSFKPTSQYALGYDTLDALAMDLQRAKDRRYY